MADIDWDSWQAQALEAASTSEALVLLGGGGTGKSTVLEELVRREATSGGRVAFIVNDRRAAGESLVRISLAVGSMSEKVEVRSLAAFAYSILAEFSEQTGRRAPELISGSDEDALLKEILESGEISFPAALSPEAQALPAFRQEIRNLITRSGELGLSVAELHQLAEEENIPLWHSAADVRAAYESRVVQGDSEAHSAPSMLQPVRLDYAHIVTGATSLLARWEEAASESNRSAKSIRKPRWSLVVVDDIQNAPRSILALLRQLRADGAAIVVAGNPDACVQGFRGAVASLPADVAAPEPEGLGAHICVLGQGHRCGPQVSAAIGEVTGRIRVAGSAGARRPKPAEKMDAIEGRRYVNAEEEAAGIARILREWHLRDGVPYSQMAVLTRSRAAHSDIRRELVRRQVPVAEVGSDLPLARHRAVIGLIRLIRLALAAPEDTETAGLEVEAILSGPYLETNPLELRRLRLAVRGIELAAGGTRTAEELFALAVNGPEAIDALHPSGLEPLRRLASMCAAIRTAATQADGRAEQVLWAAWDSAGCAERWRQLALDGGARAEQANEDLDSVLQLFRFAQRLADRDSDTTIDHMIAKLEEQELPEDSIARMAACREVVTLTTPAASQGRAFTRVVIARLNEGTWPNLTIRDTLTRTAHLSGLVTGRIQRKMGENERFRAEYEEVLDDELRQLCHSLSRGHEHVVVTCLDGEDFAPSRFFRAMGFAFEEEIVDTVPEGQPILVRPQPVRPDFDMTGLVGTAYRFARLDGSTGERAQNLLGRLAEVGVSQAASLAWAEQNEATTVSPDESSQVYVSPSRVESLLACPLRTLLQSFGFVDSTAGDRMQLGTIVHALLEEYSTIPEGMSATDFAAILMERFEEQIALEGLVEDSAWGRKQAEEAAAAFERIALFLASRGGQPLTEYHFSVKRGDAVLSGSIDRLEIDGKRSRIVDYKTGTGYPSGPATADHVQLQLYQWAIAEEGKQPPPEHAELFYPWVEGPKKADYLRVCRQEALDDAARERAEARIDSAAHVLRLGTIPAREGTSCNYCAYHAACPLQPAGRMFS